jgi:TonB family protein
MQESNQQRWKSMRVELLMNRLVLLLCLVFAGRRQQLAVQQMIDPEYPLAARYTGEQGTVAIHITIGSDGKVTSVTGSGAPDSLVKASEENVRHWNFGPFAAKCEFPISHTIRFIYRLEGKAKFVSIRPIIRADLPDEVEISATPLISDYPPLSDYKPNSQR